LIAAGLRLWNLTILPPGLNTDELTNIRITESVRAGNIAVFYNLSALGDEGGREGLYHMALAATTTVTGSGLVGYRLLSVMLNMVMLALVYALANRLFGPLAGVAALALLALGMWPIILARTIGPETAIPLITAAVMLVLARALPVNPGQSLREPGTGLFAALGLLRPIFSSRWARWYLSPTWYSRPSRFRAVPSVTSALPSWC
jgi:4-amino-4-deoxy-L-arabinose transferase-like glycosyltransferase